MQECSRLKARSLKTNPNLLPTGHNMDINKPAVLQEITAAFNQYEDALIHNKVEILDRLFWSSPHTLRYGVGENLYGFDEIAAFRASRPSQGLAREVLKTVITTYGDHYATANIEFRRRNPDGQPNPKTGRQSQTWVKFDEGWRVVAAHVSLLM